MSNRLSKSQQKFVDKLLQSFEKEIIPWRATWDKTIVKPYNATSLKEYKGINQLNLYMTSLNNNYDDPRWMTFDQARNAGYRIKKGSVGTDVFHYALRNTQTKKIVSMEEYRSMDDDKKKVVRGFTKSYVVFNAKQIDGIPKLDTKKVVIPFQNEKAKLYAETLAENMRVELKHEGQRAYYNLDQDCIVLPKSETFIDEESYYATRLHESAHATMHKSRLNRDAEGNFGSEKYAIEELRAELTSAFLAMDVGFHFNEFHELNHFAYIKFWKSKIKENPSVIFKAIKDAQVMREYMLEKGEFNKIYENEKKIEKSKIFSMKIENMGLDKLLSEKETVLLFKLGVPVIIELGYIDKNNTYYAREEIDKIVSSMKLEEELDYMKNINPAGHEIEQESDLIDLFSNPAAHGYLNPNFISYDEMPKFINTFQYLTDSKYSLLSDEKCNQIQREMYNDIPLTKEKLIKYRNQYITDEVIKEAALTSSWQQISREPINYIKESITFSDEDNIDEKKVAKETIVINLFAGPGAGKTTCAWEIASKLKKMDYVVEYVPEYAKELVWDEKRELLDGSLEHQKMLLEEQQHRVDRLIGKVDFIVTDAPCLLNLNFLKCDDMDLKNQYHTEVLNKFQQYHNFNLFINRGEKYETTGRVHTLQESIALDNSLKQILQENNIYYGTYQHQTIDVAIQNCIKTYDRFNSVQMNKQELDTDKPIIKSGLDQATNTIKNENREAKLNAMKNSISIADYARDVLGMGIIKESRGNLRLEEHDSCKIYPNNTFYRFSRSVGGSIIDFIKHFEECDTKEAIAKMETYYNENKPIVKYDVYHKSQTSAISKSVGGIEVPEKADNNKHVFAYLTKKRGIKPSIVNEYINRKVLYEDTNRNCVFLGKLNKEIFYANIRGTGIKPFKQDVTGSIKEVGVYIDNHSDTLIVNEAVIDQMSYMSMAEDPKAYNYLSVCGAANSVNAIRFHLAKRNGAAELKRVVIALDNDIAGEENALKTIDFIKENYPNIETLVHIPDAKDFNEQLQKEMELLSEVAPNLALGASN